MVMKEAHTLCIALNDAIRDENKAPVEYERLLKELRKAGHSSDQTEMIIREIIDQEHSHKRDFVRIAAEVGCPISQKKYM